MKYVAIRIRRRARPAVLLGLVFGMLLSAGTVLADGGVTGTYTGLGPNDRVSGTLDGGSETFRAGTMKFELTDGTLISTFCTDLLHHVSSGDTFSTSDEVMACPMRWLLLHYPPRQSGYSPWPDRGDALASIDQEMAARQASVWHFSDGFLPDAGTTIGARAWDIINSVPDEPCNDDQPEITLTPASVANPIGSVQTFTVNVTLGGEPVAGQVVNLSADLGTLSDDTVTTNAAGEASFTLTHDTEDTISHITASTEMPLPVGTIFVGVEPNNQKLVLGEAVPGLVQTTAVAAWTGTGAVSTVSYDDYNMNGEHDAGEPLLEGWTILLYKFEGGEWTLVGSDLTDENGLVHFGSLSTGDYRVGEVKPLGWYATTPARYEFTLEPDESLFYAFGQIKLPIVIGHVYHDDDSDQVFDTGELTLEGWDLQLYRADGSIVVGMQGATDGEGKVIFSSHPDRDPPEILPQTYYVRETLQEGWYTTTGISQTVTLGPSDIGHAWLGNDVVEPALRLEKTGPAFAHVGDVISYTLAVTNEGNVALEDVGVDDPMLGGAVCDLGTLEPGESDNCQVPFTVPAGLDPVDNTATSSGTDAFWGSEATDSDDASADILHPALDLSLVASPEEIYAGQEVELTFEVTNTSDDTTLYDVVIIHDGGTPGDPSDDQEVCTISELAPGETVICEALHTGQDTTTFTGTATGYDLIGGEAQDQTEVTITLDADGDYDNDGIPDDIEGTDDADGDGTPNFLDLDSDGDGISDEVEGTGDADGDGSPNFLDLDSDGDGIPDEIETADDADGDGTPNFLDLDSDCDGIPDEIETADDADGDGTPNFLDLDSDGDGITDEVETADDADGDGSPNFLDLDSDGDGIPDEVETADDSDGDSTPNFLDLDSDNDGLQDSEEWSTGPTDPLVGCTADDPTCSNNDADGDGTPNFLDTDSDDDGISDEEEGTGDDDGDGIPDWLDPDPVLPEPRYYYTFLPLILTNP